MSKDLPKDEFVAVSTIDIVNAIDILYSLHAIYVGIEWPQEALDKRKIQHQIIADGLRYHSGAIGIVSTGEVKIK